MKKLEQESGAWRVINVTLPDAIETLNWQDTCRALTVVRRRAQELRKRDPKPFPEIDVYTTFLVMLQNHAEKLRTYGQAPFKGAVLHGGPGAPGEMAPVAKELARFCGVLEPLQTKELHVIPCLLKSLFWWAVVHLKNTTPNNCVKRA